MTAEAHHSPVSEQFMDPGVRMQNFVDIVQLQAMQKMPQNGDPYTKAYEIAFAKNLRENPGFRNVFQEFFDWHEGLLPDDLMRQSLKTFQFVEQERAPNIFPKNRATPEAWDEPMQALVHDNAYYEEFAPQVFKKLGSSVPGRAIIPKIMLKAKGMENAHVLDIGSGLQYLAKQLILDGSDPDINFEELEIVRRVQGGRRLETVRDDTATRNFNRWIGEGPVRLASCHGIDALDYVNDSKARKRAESDSRYMGDWLNGALNKQLSIFNHVEPTNLTFTAQDATTMNAADLGRKYDATLLSTMLYETKDKHGFATKETEAILQNAREATADNGIIIVQDFIRRAYRSGRLQFYSRWPKYSYGVWVEDRQRPELGLQKYFTVYSGRIEKLIPESPLVHLPIARKLGLVARRKS